VALDLEALHRDERRDDRVADRLAQVVVGLERVERGLEGRGDRAAGLHGLREELPLPDPVSGDAYRQEAGGSVPLTLEAALDALEADEYLRDAMGAAIVDPFVAMKRFELERHRAWVSDWERDEYIHHL